MGPNLRTVFKGSRKGDGINVEIGYGGGDSSWKNMDMLEDIITGRIWIWKKRRLIGQTLLEANWLDDDDPCVGHKRCSFS